MMINNSALRRMAITNFNRSGPLTLMIEVMVPSATSASKINELLDAINAYVSESADWSQVQVYI